MQPDGGEHVDQQIGVVMLSSTALASAGGMQKQALSLANELQSQGVRAFLVTQRLAVHQALGAGSAEERADVEKVNVVSLFTLRRQPGWSFLCSFFIWAWMNRKSFHIIHAHSATLGGHRLPRELAAT